MKAARVIVTHDAITKLLKMPDDTIVVIDTTGSDGKIEIDLACKQEVHPATGDDAIPPDLEMVLCHEPGESNSIWSWDQAAKAISGNGNGSAT